MKLSVNALVMLISLLAAVAMVVVAGSVGQCATGTQTRVTGRMWRNASGHWTATANMEQSAHAHTQPVALEAEPSLRRCEGLGLMALTLTIRGEQLPPGPGYEKTNVIGSYYKVHKERKSWEDAKKVCEEENAHLLVLNSQEEADTIKELLKNHNATTGFCHIGFIDKDKEGHYVTLFGQTLLEAGYAKWRIGEPSNKTIENCGSIVASTVELNDTTCNGYEGKYICEQQA